LMQHAHYPGMRRQKGPAVLVAPILGEFPLMFR
jgi:hypothetical protein